MKTENTPRGMRIIYGQEADRMSELLRIFEDTAIYTGYRRIILPSVWAQKTFIEKAGPEISGQMYSFKDRGGRDLCLAPEGTAIVREWYLENFRPRESVDVFYAQKFYRYERPQAGRYREFTQFGVESLGPKQKSTLPLLKELLSSLSNVTYKESVKRGLNYYIQDGFEAICENLGSQKQIAGGGKYDHGEGFAIGVDRVCMIQETESCHENR